MGQCGRRVDFWSTAGEVLWRQSIIDMCMSGEHIGLISLILSDEELKVEIPTQTSFKNVWLSAIDAGTNQGFINESDMTFFVAPAFASEWSQPVYQ